MKKITTALALLLSTNSFGAIPPADAGFFGSFKKGAFIGADLTAEKKLILPEYRPTVVTAEQPPLIQPESQSAETKMHEENPSPLQDVFVGGWTEIFKTKAGDIMHTPTMIQMGGMTCGKGLNLNSNNFNGVPMLAPLILKTNSTREDFLAALVSSDLL